MDPGLCRLCYEEKANHSIFPDGGSGLATTKLLYCCKFLKIEENDGLPQRICGACDRNLEACYQFLQKCEASDRKLRLLLAQTSSAIQVQGVELIDVNTKTEVKDEHSIDDCEIINTDEIDLFPYEDLTDSPTVQHAHYKKRPRRRKNAKSMVSCSECGRKCANASALVVHRRAHSSERPHRCTRCDKCYKDAGTLRRHTERNHLDHRERRFVCETCGKGFFSKSDISVHMRVHTRETPYSCPICPIKFTQISAMLRHKKRHSDDKAHTCATCSKSFWTKEELKKHLSVHNDVRPFQCPICSVQFKHKGNISKHMTIHVDPNRYVCNHCGKTFNVKGNLQSHMNRTHSDQSGYCLTCGKNVSNFEKHMWKHTGQRPLKCEYCPSSFCEARSLALHINFKHKKTDRFKCDIDGCALAFPSKPMMMYHIARFHNMQTPYPCDRCQRGFYRKNDLSRHKIGTHKERLL